METVEEGVSIRTYRYKWVILIIFCLYSSINFLQFLQYSIVANIMTRYYEVSRFMVDLTGLVFMIVFILFCIPANYFIYYYNLRVTAIFSSGLTAVGNLLKLLSVSRGRFYLVIISQILCAIAQVFMLCIPSKLASTWFGANEVSTACALAVLGTQLGIAIGAILPTYVIKNSPNIEDIGHDLSEMLYYNAGVTCAIFILVLIFFRAKPKSPPSLSQVTTFEGGGLPVLQACKEMLKNKHFIILLLIFGAGNGIWTSFGLLINAIYLEFFPNSEEAVGIITFTSVVMGGCIGSVVFGFILDKTHKFRFITFLTFLCSAILLIIVILILVEQIKLASYFIIPAFSFFLASTLVISFEFATEVTFPLPESLSCAVVNVAIYIFGIIFTLIFEALFDAIGYSFTTGIIVVILLICAGSTYFLTPTLRRREANLQNT